MLLAAACCLVSGTAAGTGRGAHLAASSPSLPATLQTLPLATEALVDGVRLPFGNGSAALHLERFDVFTPDATIVIHGADGEAHQAAPHPVMYRGSVEGEPGSVVFLTAPADGPVEGFARTAGRLLRLTDAVDGRLELRDELSREMAVARPFTCGTETLPPVPASAAEIPDAAAQGATSAASGSWYGVEVAVETDYEFYAKFPNVGSATSYVAVLFGGAAAIYRADLDTNLVVNSLSLWTGGAGSDPWTYTDSCRALADLGNYWHTNHPMVNLPRDTVHLLSGKSLGGGIAWVGVLAAGDHSQTINCGGSSIATYSGGYGMVGSIAGNYYPSNVNPVWDIIAVSHEIGHNFNSPHTHCYNGIGGTEPVDTCYSGEPGCYAGPTSVPTGGGSIMSYCHLKAGGYNNINLSFGAPGLYGTNSERVPERMRAKVDAVHSSLTSTIFWDGFESEGTYFWSTAAP